MAYELQDLKDCIIKAGGAEVTEDVAKAIVSGLMDWLIQEAAESENKADDVIAGFLVPFKSMVLAKLESIDEVIKGE